MAKKLSESTDYIQVRVWSKNMKFTPLENRNQTKPIQLS